MSNPEPPANGNRYWHVGREVPVALIVTIVATFVSQTIAAAWWVAVTSSRIEVVERRLDAAAPHTERIIRLEEKIGVVQQGINDIKASLARMPPGRQ